MKTIQLSGLQRADVGRSAARASRKEGQIPAVIYGGSDQISFTINEKEIKKVIFSPFVYLFELNIAGQSKKALIKDVQFHPVTDRILHLDFIELLPGKLVKASLPLQITGNAPGIARGGSKIVHFRKIRVMASIETLVDFVNCDISALDIDDKIRVKDLSANGLTILEEPNAVVVAIQASRASRKAEEEAAKAEKDSKKK